MNDKLTQEEIEELMERYELAVERIALISQEETVKEPYRSYFQKVAAFIMMVDGVAKNAKNGTLQKLKIEELQGLNRALYEDIHGDNYEVSYANPAYACRMLGKKDGKLLAFLYTELRNLIVYAFEKREHEFIIFMELFIEIYNYYEEQDEFTYKDAKRAIYNFMYDNCPILVNHRLAETCDINLSFARDIIMNSDLNDLSYLYQFGEYVSENELQVAKFLNSLSEQQIQAMADTYTEGYRRGFEAYRIDLSKKRYVGIRYQLGFERMVRTAVHNFERLGLETIIFRAAGNAINKRGHLKIGYYGTSVNKQYDYDHRFDIALFLDKALNERRLKCSQDAFEQYKDYASLYAGPAVIETFGEKIYSYEEKGEAIKLDKRQQKLYTDFYNKYNLINNQYFKRDEISFTIISYPIPEIGDNFEAIFADTVKVNTLDNELYRGIQQYLIDALDEGEYVRVLGSGSNHTDMRIKLYPLKDKSKETGFENCVADVNIPVGEVFTSPVLEGTRGVLHVPQVFLHGLEYRELELKFEDGMVTDYTCKNYEEEEKNKSFIKENLLYNHESLPLGEFAIGTNTTAYMMARKYDIAALLPILIAEKTGPHFAIGDTCFPNQEDSKLYNPDGKEIMAKENSISALRKTDISKAYFNCHTDITLPYEELSEISVILKDGSTIEILKDARFVLAGTEELNKAFDNQ